MTDTFYEMLISNVKNSRTLWDTGHKSYHNRLLVDKEWSRIGDDLGESKEIIKSKWRNLRDRFKKELKKISQQRTGTDGKNAAAYNVTWCHFDSLLFLKSILTSRTTEGQITFVEVPAEQEDQSSDFPHLELISDNTCCEERDNVGESKQPVEDETEKKSLPDVPTQKAPIPAYRKRKLVKKRADSIEKEFLKLEAKKVALLKKNADEDDEDINFFKSLLPHVRLLPSIIKLHFRSQVQYLLANELMKVHNKQSTNASYDQLTHLPDVSPASTSSVCFSAPLSPADSQPVLHQQYKLETYENDPFS